MSQTNYPPIIIEIGSSYTRAGFANNEINNNNNETQQPTCIFPTIIGTPKQKQILTGYNKSYYVGEEAVSKRGILNLTSPYLDRKKQEINFGSLEKLLTFIFNDELRVNENEALQYSVLLSEGPCQSNANREKIVQIMFERFPVSTFTLQNEQMLSLYSIGRTTGVVLDSGENMTFAVPIQEGKVLSNAINQLSLGGKDVTNYLFKLLNENRNLNFNGTLNELSIVKEIKEKLCYIAFNFEEELMKMKMGRFYKDRELRMMTFNYEEELKKEQKLYEKSFELPDGREIKIGSEMIESTEILFQPKLLLSSMITTTTTTTTTTATMAMDINKENLEKELGVSQLIVNSVEKLNDYDFRKQLFKNIVLSGGNSKFQMFKERISFEIGNSIPTSKWGPQYQVISANDNSVWVGGSMMSLLSSFNEKWITNVEYEEYGSVIVNRKCF